MYNIYAIGECICMTRDLSLVGITIDSPPMTFENALSYRDRVKKLPHAICMARDLSLLAYRLCFVVDRSLVPYPRS